jgi:AcrR family transcriptional regulator
MSTWADMTSKDGSGTPKRAPRQARAFRGVPAEERKRERRDRLLEAGLQLFGTRVYHHVTVRDVCAGAKLTERYFYESFPNLETLFGEIYARLHGELKQLTFMAAAQAAGDPERLAEAALRAFFGYVAQDPRRGQIMFTDTLLVGMEMTKRAEDAAHDYEVMMRSFIALLMPNSAENHGLNPDLIAQGLVGVNVFLFWRWRSNGFKAQPEELVQNALAFFRAMIRYAQQPQATETKPVVNSERRHN